MEVENCKRTDMDQAAAEKALDLVASYYCVGVKHFIETVAQQVIETHIVRQIPTMLSMEWVSSLSNDDVRKLAAEPLHVTKERSQLEDTMKKMQLALNKFQQDLAGIC